jgi:hypothetical protein
VTAVCALLFAYHAVRFVQVQISGHREAAHRRALIAAAAAGSVVRVPTYQTPRSRWFRGDDFRMAELREYVAHEIFGLAGIEYTTAPVWVQPSLPGTFVASRTYDPPLSPALEARAPLPPFASSFVTAVLVQLRLHLVLDDWRALDGHPLVRYQVDARDTGFVDPRQRPLHLVEWTPSQIRFVDAAAWADDNLEPQIRLWAPSMPAGWTEAYTVGCGATAPATLRPEGEDLVVPVPLACRAPYLAVVCAPEACWLAGSFARW